MPYRRYQQIQTFASVITMLIMFGCLLMVIALINRNNRTGLTNQTYNRATNCFAATSPLKRTPEYVKLCYDRAERATGIKIERYGEGR